MTADLAPPSDTDREAAVRARAVRALRTLSHCNQALVRATSEQGLLAAVCEGIVLHGGYRMAWVGYAEHDPDKRVRVVAGAGDTTNYLAEIRTSWGEGERGRGPTGTAIKTGRPAIVRDAQTDPNLGPWRDDARRLGINSGCVLPLVDAGGTSFGALTVYAGDVDAFDDEETRLLNELAEDLAFGLAALRTRREHAQAESSLAASDALLRQLIKHTPAAVAMFDREMRYLQASERWISDYKLTGQEVIGRSHYEVFPDVPERWKVIHQRVLAGAVERCDEDPFARADGSVDWLEWEVRPWFDRDGAIGGLTMFTQVITERKRTEEALRSSEDRFRSAMLHSPIGMAIVGLRGAWLEVNPALCRIVGHSREELLQRDFQSITHPEDLDADVEYVRQMLAREIETYQLEKRLVHKDGRVIWAMLHVSLVLRPDGMPRHFIAQIEDVTERRLTEQSLREGRTKLLLAMDVARIGCWEYDVASDLFTFDGDFYGLYGTSAAREGGPHMSAAEYGRRFLPPDEAHVVAAEIGLAIATDDPHFSRQIEHRIVRGDGTIGHVSVRYGIVKDKAGRTVKCYGANQDISERYRAEQALRDSEERLRQLAENLREVVWISTLDHGQILYASPSYQLIWGRSCESLFRDPQSWLDAVHPEDRERVRAAVELQASGEYDVVFRVVRPDGSVRWVHDRAFPVKDAAGRIYRIAGVAEDITDRKRIEEQFRQAQKMEGIGQLAGGVAHDFNNILAAIMMQAEEAACHPSLPDDVSESLSEINRAAERAANLTRQLLQFSRKQVMQARNVDLNEVVTNLAKMLQRVLREDISMQLHLHPVPLVTHADVGMLEQVLMNLAVNARDAMPDGGRLRIETTEVMVSEAEARTIPDASPGPHVCLKVSDSGCGIAPEHLARIFEPFFTTKEPGQGTGLGLATVFGIVRQHKGWVTVASTVGEGTTFQVLLVAADELSDPSVSTVRRIPRGGYETVLVVEDDPVLRRLLQTLLERHGYHVLEARTGLEGLAVWERQGGQVDLLLTDVVMPEGMSGRALAAELQRRAPQLKVILTSGYSEDLAGRELQLQKGQVFLQKPTQPHELLAAIRRSLDA